MQQILQSLQQSFAPGTIFSYGHTSHVLVSTIIEEITRLSWAENVSKLFVDEFHGTFSVDPTFAIPHPHRWCGPLAPAEPWTSRYRRGRNAAIQATTGNFVFTDVKTLALLGQKLLTQSELASAECILSDRAKGLLRMANWRPLWGGSPFFGVGLKKFASGCYGHRSSSGGYNILVLIYPQRALALSVATNVDSGILAQKLMMMTTSKDCDLTVSKPDGELPIRGRKAFFGRYLNCSQIVEIGATSGYLTFSVIGKHPNQDHSTPPVRLIPMTSNSYIGPSPFATLPGEKNGAMIEFIDDNSSERFQWIRINEVAYRRIDG